MNFGQFVFVGETVFVVLLSPALLGSEFPGFGDVLPDAVPDGVFGDMDPVEPLPIEEPPVPGLIAVPDVLDPEAPVLGVLIEPVVPAGVLLLSPGVVDVEPLPVEPDCDGDAVASLPVEGVLDVDPVVALLPVPAVVDGFDIELSVFGWSALLQAPSAARVAAIATHLIELRMSVSWFGVCVAGCAAGRRACVGYRPIDLSVPCARIAAPAMLNRRAIGGSAR